MFRSNFIAALLNPVFTQSWFVRMHELVGQSLENHQHRHKIWASRKARFEDDQMRFTLFGRKIQPSRMYLVVYFNNQPTTEYRKKFRSSREILYAFLHSD